LNNEFLKGIEAREKVVQLKKIIKVDSAQLSLYRDTIVPEYQEALTRSENLLIEREEFIISQTKWIKFLSYLSGGLGLITLGLII
jgi:hypothetical protein